MIKKKKTWPEQLREEIVYFDLWVQRDESPWQDGIAASGWQGGRTKKLKDPIFSRDLKAERGN